MGIVWRGLAAAVLLLLLAACAYRAATQSITHDEAFTWREFVEPPLRVMLSQYDANNHVLYTLLAKMSTAAFGASELALRLPALCAAALLFVSLYGIGVRVCGATPWLPLLVAVSASNAYLLDFLTIARGYGLASALLAVSWWLLTGDPVRRKLAGVAVGLSVAANLTFAFPAAGLCAGVLLRDRRRAAPFLLAAAMAAAAVLGPFMMAASRDKFYFGTDDPWASPASLVSASIYHNLADRSLPVVIGAAIAAAALAAVIVSGFLRRRSPAEPDRFLFLIAAAATGAIVLPAAAHAALAIPLPYGRTGLYGILLFGPGLVAWTRRDWPRSAPGLAVSLACLYLACSAWTTGSTADWEYDAGAKRIAEHLPALERPAARPLRIGASWLVVPALEYYRLRGNWTWLAPISRDGPRQQADFDAYIVLGDDRALIEERRLRILYDDPVSRVVLAAP